MTVKTGEKRQRTRRSAPTPAADPLERALVVHTLAQNLYQQFALRQGTTFRWGRTPPVGWRAAGPGMGYPAPPPAQGLPPTPLHFTGRWSG